jgi:release factor H-coupled RctB family protein
VNRRHSFRCCSVGQDEDRALLIEEAPEAYKSIEGVIADLEAFGLARVVASFRPIVTVKKVVAGPAQREDRR